MVIALGRGSILEGDVDCPTPPSGCGRDIGEVGSGTASSRTVRAVCGIGGFNAGSSSSFCASKFGGDVGTSLLLTGDSPRTGIREGDPESLWSTVMGRCGVFSTLDAEFVTGSTGGFCDISSGSGVGDVCINSASTAMGESGGGDGSRSSSLASSSFLERVREMTRLCGTALFFPDSLDRLDSGRPDLGAGAVKKGQISAGLVARWRCSWLHRTVRISKPGPHGVQG